MSERVSVASERANGRASGPVLNESIPESFGPPCDAAIEGAAVAAGVVGSVAFGGVELGVTRSVEAVEIVKSVEVDNGGIVGLDAARGYGRRHYVVYSTGAGNLRKILNHTNCELTTTSVESI